MPPRLTTHLGPDYAAIWTALTPRRFNTVPMLDSVTFAQNFSVAMQGDSQSGGALYIKVGNVCGGGDVCVCVRGGWGGGGHA